MVHLTIFLLDNRRFRHKQGWVIESLRVLYTAEVSARESIASIGQRREAVRVSVGPRNHAFSAHHLLRVVLVQAAHAPVVLPSILLLEGALDALTAELAEIKSHLLLVVSPLKLLKDSAALVVHRAVVRAWHIRGVCPS